MFATFTCTLSKLNLTCVKRVHSKHSAINTAFKDQSKAWDITRYRTCDCPWSFKLVSTWLTQNPQSLFLDYPSPSNTLLRDVLQENPNVKTLNPLLAISNSRGWFFLITGFRSTDLVAIITFNIPEIHSFRSGSTNVEIYLLKLFNGIKSEAQTPRGLMWQWRM